MVIRSGIENSAINWNSIRGNFNRKQNSMRWQYNSVEWQSTWYFVTHQPFLKHPRAPYPLIYQTKTDLFSLPRDVWRWTVNKHAGLTHADLGVNQQNFVSSGIPIPFHSITWRCIYSSTLNIAIYWDQYCFSMTIFGLELDDYTERLMSYVIYPPGRSLH